MLRVEDMHTRIGATPVHNGISVTVGDGEIVAILGSNGAGKTSFLRAVIGLLPLASGSITFDGTKLSTLPPHRRNELGLAYVPEGRRIFASMTVRENLEIGAYGRAPSPADLSASVEEMFQRFPVLREKADADGATLSGGQQQMLAIGRSLMSKPRLLLLDEPSLGLAPQLVAGVRDAIRELGRQKQMSILLVEQNAGLALSVADRIYLMARGRIVEEGTPAELGSGETLRSLYLGHTEAGPETASATCGDRMTPDTDRTLLGSLERAAMLRRGAAAVRFTDGESHTADELLDKASRFASLLAASGVKAGDRVAILCSNRVEFIWAFFGACWLSAVPGALNVSVHGPILRHMLENLDPTVIVCEAGTVGAVRAVVGGKCNAAIVDIDDSAEVAVLRGQDPHVVAAPRQSVASRDLAMILYTSGTTGPSKGIMYSHEMAIAFADATHWMLGFKPSDTAFNCLPLFHGNSLLCTLIPALRVGALSVFGPRFSASTYWETVRAEGATVLSLLGSMVPILLNQPPSPEDGKSRARIALAVPCPKSNFHEFQQRFGLKLSSLYGMTDIGLPIGVPHDIPGRPGMCGVLHPDWECIVADENDAPVPDGMPGELLVRPRKPFIMQLGYWRNPEATVETWRNLWFHTGDQLRRDSDGWYEFLDRKKDAIRRFGENISSFEVESVLLEHPTVAEVAVYAVPAELAEDEVMASVILEPGQSATPNDLLAHCEASLPYFAVPRYIRITRELPKTQTAKVQKAELRKIGIDSLTWDAGPRGRSKRS